MAPQYKLTYLNARGITEPIRLLLALARIEYEDIRFEREEFSKIKSNFPWGRLPVLEGDGVTLCQSKAIARYLARKYGFGGESEVEMAKCDEYVDVVMDDLRLEAHKWFHEQDEVKKAELLKSMEQEIMPGYLSKFEGIIKQNRNGVLVGKKITYADLYLANMVQQMTVYFSGLDMTKFPVIQQHSQLVFSQPGIKEWIEQRPKTVF